MKSSEMKNKDLLLYAVTDRKWLKDGVTLADECKKAIDGGVTMIQLREKELGYDDFLAQAKELKTLCQSRGIPFIVNDNVQIAIEVGADGIHVGQEDMHADDVRKLAGKDMILGVSAQNVEEAVTAEKNGADYLGVGAVFPTSSKDDASEVDFETLKEICQSVSIPVVAIGGITEDNIKELKGSGIVGISVISAIFAQEDIKDACERLCANTERILPADSSAYKDVKGAIFDIDGTLIDSMKIWDKAGLMFLEKHGIKGDEDLGKRLFAMTIGDAGKYIQENFLPNMKPEEISAGVNDVIRGFYINDAQPKEGMIELIKTLKEEGVKLTVATSTDRDVFMPCLERLGLDKYFDGIFTCTEVGHSKAEPEIFNQALELMGTSPKETWVFEDGLYSAKTAKSLGMKVAAVYDETSRHDWDEFRLMADAIIRIND